MVFAEDSSCAKLILYIVCAISYPRGTGCHSIIYSCPGDILYHRIWQSRQTDLEVFNANHDLTVKQNTTTKWTNSSIRIYGHAKTEIRS